MPAPSQTSTNDAYPYLETAGCPSQSQRRPKIREIALFLSSATGSFCLSPVHGFTMAFYGNKSNANGHRHYAYKSIFAKSTLIFSSYLPGPPSAMARVRRAQQLLETTGLSVEEVAAHSGFKSASVLREHFDGRSEETPLVYRRIGSGRVGAELRGR